MVDDPKDPEPYRDRSQNSDPTEFIEKPAASAGRTPRPASAPRDPSGSRPAFPPQIGAYRILRIVGEGGMGTVFEAEQERPRRIVALKMIRLGLASESILRRFEQESQVLGKLHHPGIAQIYEAGSADLGHGPQPYLAMEFVHGMPLDEYLKATTLDNRARLELMARICDAVDHAHTNGIVHRDLKPGNILVDETGQPKVLDFGLARIADSDVHATMHTDFGQILGTLPYMSPEQVGGDGELDHRSDVYSLGVILYQMLAGRLPYDIKKNQVAEGIRIIREEDPSRLSTVSRVYRGDIETISAKALAKEKVWRYQSAADLAADIRRHLKHEPIVARPPSTAYQLRKFAERNRALVAGLGAAFGVLVIGVIVSTWLAVRATRAERLATSRLKQTQDAQAQTEAVNTFLEDMLRSADPVEKMGRDVTVLQVIDDAAKKIADKSLSTTPTVQSAVQTSLGLTYQALGQYREAEPHLRGALETRLGLYGAEHQAVAASEHNLASLLHDQGEYEAADKLYREALRVQRKLVGDDLKVSSILNDLGILLKEQGDLAGAESLYRESLAIKRQTLGDETRDVALVLNNLGTMLNTKGDRAAAEPLLREALATRRKILGNENPDVAQSINNLAALLMDKGELEESERLHREALVIRRKAFGNDHQDVAVTLNNLAAVVRDRGDLDQAEALYREAQAIFRKVVGEDHPYFAISVDNLGGVEHYRGNFAAAERLYREALALRTKRSSDSPDVAKSLYSLGLLHMDRGDPRRAEPMLRKSLAIRIQKFPARHANIASSEAGLGWCLVRLRQPAEAESLLVEALSIREEKLWAGHWLISETRSMLGESLAAQKKFEAAEPLLVRAYADLKDNPATPATRKQAARERIEELYAAWHRPDKAATWRASRGNSQALSTAHRP